MPTPEHVSNHKDGTAYHVGWEFRREAFVWQNERPVLPNFYPYATELHGWLLRKNNLNLFTESEQKADVIYSNPHTFHCSSLIAIAMNVINEAHAAANRTDDVPALDAEIMRVRSMNEQVLYITRICEALIK